MEIKPRLFYPGGKIQGRPWPLKRHSHGTTGALTNVKILLHLKINIRNAKGMQPHARP